MLFSSLQLQRMWLLSCLSLLFYLADAKKDSKSACSTCQSITDNFNKGLDRTVKQNFGGGNTAWEERKLSKYETSEIRLMEIVEGLCDSSSFECNQMVEEHEDLFETWWFKRKTKDPDLHKWFCIENLRVCCPKGTFGPDCNSCVGGSEKPCHGNGRCDGDGTRGGDGRCSCDHGYEGEFCLDCIDGYFSEERNDTFSLCTECHSSCKTCSGSTHRDCDECRDGWEEDEQEACVDVNECSRDPRPCEEDQYCTNSEGSYSCQACDKVCAGCTGSGPEQCEACASGYQLTESTCTDVDECAQLESPCSREHQECVNKPGRYVCVCSSGYEEREGECVPTQQPEKEEEPEAAETTGSPHAEL